MQNERVTKKNRKKPPPAGRFRAIINDFYTRHGRRFLWRDTRDPYHIFISEMMLQQTQVERVTQKYPQFIQRFPDITTLAHSTLHRVLEAWQGLGYNRRALLIHRAAQVLAGKHNGKFPRSRSDLLTLPGIGQSTAGAICAFAYNIPCVFIETNIRRVFIHFFFPRKKNVHDRDIAGLVQETLDKKNPRRWYWALMDYGTYLKKTSSNPNLRSAHYGRQSRFEGSNRQVRGAILRTLTQTGSMTEAALTSSLPFAKRKIAENLTKLNEEGFLKKQGRRFSIR